MNSKYRILFAILLLLGFQQFPVIRIGGSLKIYEVLGLLLLLLYGVRRRNNIFIFSLFLFFIVSPVLSLISFYIFRSDVSSFFRLYPFAVGNFRFNIFVYPILQILFMWMNYSVCYHLYYSKALYHYFNSIKKGIVILGFIIACYSIFSFLFVDFVAYLPDYIQHKTVYINRSSGFSLEPSFYVLYQGWIVLFTYYSKDSFRYFHWIILFITNLLSLILTFSSSLVIFVGAILLVIIINAKLKYKFLYSFLLVGCMYMGYCLLSIYFDTYWLNYAFYQKIEDFVIGNEDAGGSGGGRRYTSNLGWIEWKDNPILGLGVGNSIYYMHEAEKKTTIISSEEQLNADVFPQNSFSCVFAEQGLVGGVFFVVILSAIFKRVWQYRKEKFGNLFLVGTIFNICTLWAIAPIYSMFIWGYMFFALGYIRYQKEQNRFKMIIKV